jgi:hypothetical protein
MAQTATNIRARLILPLGSPSFAGYLRASITSMNIRPRICADAHSVELEAASDTGYVAEHLMLGQGICQESILNFNFFTYILLQARVQQVMH